MTVIVLSPILLSFRYYRNTSIALIEASYNAMGKKNRRVVDGLIYAAIIVVPILSFVLFRLYVIGHFKWW